MKIKNFKCVVIYKMDGVFIDANNAIYDKYISDLESGNYENWLQKYPEYNVKIFQDLIDVNMDNLTSVQGFEYLLNIRGDFRNGLGQSVYPLEALAEFRKLNNMKVLLDAGVDSNLGDFITRLATVNYLKDNCIILTQLSFK